MAVTDKLHRFRPQYAGPGAGSVRRLSRFGTGTRGPHAAGQEVRSISYWKQYGVTVVAQGVSRVVSLGAAFAGFILVARVLGTESLGQLAFVMAFLTVGADFATFGTTAALTRGLADAKSHDPQGYYGNFLLLRVALGGATLAVSIPVAFAMRPDLVHPLVVGCLAIPLVAARFFETVYQVFERVRYAVYASLVLGFAQLSAAVVALLWLDTGLVGYIYGFVAAQLLHAMVATGLSLRLVSPRFRFDAGTMRAILVLSAPIGVSSLFNPIYSRADVFMLSYLRSDHEVGIYNAAFRLRVKPNAKL